MGAIVPNEDFLFGGIQSQLGATENLERSVGQEENGVGAGQGDFANDCSQVLVEVGEGTGDVVSFEHRWVTDTASGGNLFSLGEAVEDKKFLFSRRKHSSGYKGNRVCLCFEK
jgi:hypothetical protein